MEPDPPQRITRLTPLADVLARIDAAVKPVAPSIADPSAALGRTLAEAVVIAAPIPAAALALRDGWAVASDLTTDAGAYAPAPVPTAVRIDVGQPLPPGADAVAPLDAMTLRNGAAQVLAPVVSGEGVLPAGADVSAGAVLLAAGTRLSRVHISLLAAAGIARAQIRAPRVALLRANPGSDAAIDAALNFVAGDIGAAGGIAIARDAALADALQTQEADAVVAIGGTGSGRNDASVTTLARTGRVEVHGIALAPGETAAFGFVGPRPVLLLPGRFDAAAAVWLIVGRLLLTRLSGDSDEPPQTKAKLGRKVASALGLAELVPVRLRDGTAEPIASGYVSLSTLAQSHGFILVPAESEGYPPGAEVMVRPWP